MIIFPYIRFTWFKGQGEDVKTKVIADDLAGATTALNNLSTDFNGSLPGGPNDARNQQGIVHAQEHLQDATITESKPQQKGRVVRIINGMSDL